MPGNNLQKVPQTFKPLRRGFGIKKLNTPGYSLINLSTVRIPPDVSADKRENIVNDNLCLRHFIKTNGTVGPADAGRFESPPKGFRSDRGS
jgi:hypothetical protein